MTNHLILLFVLEPAFNPFSGGVQKTTYKLGKYFTDKGVKVSYLSMGLEGHVEPEYGRLYYLNNSSHDNPYEEGYISQVLSEVKPDVVINQNPYNRKLRLALSSAKSEYNFILIGCLRNSLFSFKSNIPNKVKESLRGIALKLAVSRIGLKVVNAYHYLKHSRDLKRIIDHHDWFILLAPPNRKELEHFVGDYKSHKVRSIPNSIPKVFEPSKKEKTLLYVGRLDVSQKRTDLLVPVWEKLYEDLPDWNFVIVGDGPYKSNIDEDIRNLNLPRIETTGRQDPNPYYSKAAIFVMPSAYEGFPNVIMEAHSHSVVPVVFDNYMALSWIVNDGEDSVLVKPFDVAEMAAKIKELVQNPEQLRGMAKAANRNAERFTIDRVGQIWLEFFEELIPNGTKK